MKAFRPNRFFTRISRIDIEHDIVGAGFDCVLLDVDNTILTRDTHEVPEDVRAWMDDLQAAGVRICLLSNNFHHGVYEWADRLDLPVVAKALKPLPHAFLMALSKMGAKRKTTLMIGDQLITDVWGSHFVGLTCYLVQPLVSTDLWHTLALRHVEKLFIHGLEPER